MNDIYTRLEKLRLLYKKARDNNDVNEMKRIVDTANRWKKVLAAREKYLEEMRDWEEKKRIMGVK